MADNIAIGLGIVWLFLASLAWAIAAVAYVFRCRDFKADLLEEQCERLGATGNVRFTREGSMVPGAGIGAAELGSLEAKLDMILENDEEKRP